MNQIGFEVMSEPALATGKPVMFVAGNDAAGKKVVLELVINAGDLSIARLIEPYALSWISPDGAAQHGPSACI